MRHAVRHKFNAVPVEYDGIKFPSKKEGNYYLQLKALVKSGAMLFFLRQVPFHLPGEVVYRVDFQEFWANGEVRFIDVKGVDTPVSKMKRKQVEALYPVKIELA